MKMFGWMQNKFNDKNGSRKINASSQSTYQVQNGSYKEEFSDWPHGLLAIGTFGNKVLGSAETTGKISRDNLPEPEETETFHHDQAGPTRDDTESDTPDITLDPDRHRGDSCPDEYSTGVVVCDEKGLSVDKKLINKKSFSFLLKMFVCGSGLTPMPRLRDQVPESRFEKILRAMLHKKIYPQNPNQIKSIKGYLMKNRERFSNSIRNSESEDDDDINEKAYDGSKWVKTDSEYIVLEM